MATQPLPPEVDGKLAALDTVPLFMKTLPTEDTDDAVISALQSLAYEGTADEIAQNFKEQGNEYFKGKRYREALGFYTQAVDAKPTDILLQEALLCNRAACNLELKNFGSVLRDCSRALSMNPQSSKAFYRSAMALLALDRPEEAAECCDRCLVFDQKNKGVESLRERAQKEKEEKERERKERIRKESEAKLAMNAAFRERNLIPVGRPGAYAPHFDLEGTLIIPTLFLYPQHATSDLIPDAVEDSTFEAHLGKMFPPEGSAPEWDEKGEYVTGELVVYATTNRKRVMKVGKKKRIREVFDAVKGDGIEIIDGCLRFVVLPKGEVERKWVDDYKLRNT